jgi:hypothetical protein
VFDVDRHVGVDLGESLEELRPVRDVMADADRDEPPGRVSRPGVAPVPAAGRDFAFLAAEWTTGGGPSHRMHATTSMPCHITCDGCISVATRTPGAWAKASMSPQYRAATSH